MITDALLNFAYFVLDAFVKLLPPFSLTVPWDKISSLSSFLYSADHVAPVTELSWCLSAVVTIFTVMIGAKFVVKVADWIMDIIP